MSERETTGPSAELTGLIGQLYMRKPSASAFLRSPQPMLDGKVPNDMIRDGREGEVISALRGWLRENP